MITSPVEIESTEMIKSNVLNQRINVFTMDYSTFMVLQWIVTFARVHNPPFSPYLSFYHTMSKQTTLQIVPRTQKHMHTIQHTHTQNKSDVTMY